jgi:hypothetical protein
MLTVDTQRRGVRWAAVGTRTAVCARAAVCAGAAVAILSLWLLSTVTSGARAAVVTGVCPPSAAGTPPSTAPASDMESQPAQVQIVACVGKQPITEALAQHWIAIARSEASGPTPKTNSPSAHGSSTSFLGKGGPPSAQIQKRLIVQVMGFLVSADWVIGEARDLNIHVAPATVKRQFASLRKQQFPRLKDFQMFLKETGQTISDLLLRTELNLLSQRIQQRIEAGEHGASNKQRALTRFVARFRRKWKAQTYCTPEYAVQDCGHVQASL